MCSTSRVNRDLLPLQIIICSTIDLVWCQSRCTSVQRFGQATGVVEAVSRISYSIGYSGISSVVKELNVNTTGDPCRTKLASMQNKAGATVQASIDGAQSAVRSRANALLFESTCPGFGMCADVLDAEDYDVWPITAMTVSRTPLKRKFRSKYRSCIQHAPISLSPPQKLISTSSTRSTLSFPSSAVMGAAPPCERHKTTSAGSSPTP